MSITKIDEGQLTDLRRLIHDCFITDGRCTVDGLDAVANAIERAKGFEFLATETKAGLDNVAASINNLAAAVREGQRSIGVTART
jgi:hypothetical protein